MDVHTGPYIDYAQIAYTFIATFACVFLGCLAAIRFDRWRLEVDSRRKSVSDLTQGDTVVGEKPHKRAPVYGTPEKAAMYEAGQGRDLPPHWKGR